MQHNNSHLGRFPLFASTMFLILIQLPAQAEIVRPATMPSRTDRTLSTRPKATKPTPTLKKPTSTIPTRTSPAGTMQNGYCCVGGKTIRSSEKDCSRKRGHFFTDQRSAQKSCQAEQGYCCKEGKVGKSSRGNCERSQGIFFLQQNQAKKSCAATRGFCCDKGQVAIDSKGSCDQKRGSFFTQQKNAQNQCAKQSGYCCESGAVSRMTSGDCKRKKGAFSLQKQTAVRVCQQEKGYCCSEGKVLALNRGRCEQKKGSFSLKRNEASRGCTQTFATQRNTTRTPVSPKNGTSPSARTAAKVKSQGLHSPAPANSHTAPRIQVASLSKQTTGPVSALPVPAPTTPDVPADQGIGEKDIFPTKGSSGLPGKENPLEETAGFGPGGAQDPLGNSPFGNSPLDNMPSKTDMQSGGGSGDRTENYSGKGNIGGYDTGGSVGIDESGQVNVGAKVGGYGTDTDEVGGAMDDLGSNDDMPSDDVVDLNNQINDNENPNANDHLDAGLANSQEWSITDDTPSDTADDNSGDNSGDTTTEDTGGSEGDTPETEENGSDSSTGTDSSTGGNDDEEDDEGKKEEDATEGDSEPTKETEGTSPTESYDNPERDGYPTYTGDNPLAGTPLESAGTVPPSTGLTKNDLVTDPPSDADNSGAVPENIPGTGVTRTGAATNPNPEKVERPVSVDQLHTKIIQKIDTLINPPLEHNSGIAMVAPQNAPGTVSSQHPLPSQPGLGDLAIKEAEQPMAQAAQMADRKTLPSETPSGQFPKGGATETLPNNALLLEAIPLGGPGEILPPQEKISQSPFPISELKLSQTPLNFNFANGKFTYPQQAASGSLQVHGAALTITCGLGSTLESANLFVFPGYQSYHNIHKQLDSSGKHLFNELNLLTNQEFSRDFDTTPGQGYQGSISFLIERFCKATDGNVTRDEKKIDLGLTYRTGSSSQVYAAMQRVGYRHSCPDGYRIEGTTESSTSSFQDANNPKKCIKQ